MPGGAPSVFAPVWSRIWGTWDGAQPLFPAVDSSKMLLSKLLRSSGLLRTSAATAEALGGHILAFTLPLSLFGVRLCHMPSRETNTPLTGLCPRLCCVEQPEGAALFSLYLSTGRNISFSVQSRNGCSPDRKSLSQYI